MSHSNTQSTPTGQGGNQRLIRRPEVEARTALSRSTLYEWIKRGDFPRPLKLGARIVAWRESDVNEWLESRQRAE